ncbi:hypothetical protein K488DRAFT_89013 [Vararia minispora EC-137]|uniref:Uncharacterized protein n=1 Tax=Vararia minispora EC-137 TaxID=1314806 RepID=A0ACB8QBF8_9AGAM|nr:hypothetical protein K488DRAFT_89013 [Vararia minispora EC-137]
MAKRGSPGAESSKNGDPLATVDIGEEEVKILNELQKDVQRVELILERRAQEALTPVYEKRREALKKIDKFWPVALTRNSIIAFSAQHDADRLALSYLEDVWVVRDKREPKVFTLEFTFKENPFFSDTVLKKEYRFVPPPGEDAPDADGITQAMLDFSWERDVIPQKTSISWKDDSKNLTKLYPLVVDAEDPDDAADPGSFFNFFEAEKDYNDLGVTIANEIFPDAIQYFTGDMGDDDDEEDDEEDEEDDDEEEEEIDLEKPRAKKAKNA